MLCNMHTILRVGWCQSQLQIRAFPSPGKIKWWCAALWIHFWMRRTSFLLVCAVSYQRVGIRFPSCAKLTQNLPLALELCWLIKFGPEAGLAARNKSCQKGLSPSGSPPSPFFQPGRNIRKTQVAERSFWSTAPTSEKYEHWFKESTLKESIMFFSTYMIMPRLLGGPAILKYSIDSESSKLRVYSTCYNSVTNLELEAMERWMK